MSLPFAEKSLFLAPMEGVTDETYRLCLDSLFGLWDFMACDFLRVPAGDSTYKDDFLMNHYGKTIFKSPKLQKKNYYQILTTEKAKTTETVKDLDRLGFKWLDLNLGCPSKTVNAHKGGAYLLEDLKILERIVTEIRQNFSQTFTAKIRIGYNDDKNFLDILSLLENCGVEAITIHARTRAQLYKGTADWSYLEKAVKHSNLPIIGNGDVWDIWDIEKMFNQTGCHSIMIARGALKTPWLASLYKRNKHQLEDLKGEMDYFNDLRKQNIKKYFSILHKAYEELGRKEGWILGRFKSLSRYLFDDLPNGKAITSQILRVQSLEAFLEKIEAIR